MATRASADVFSPAARPAALSPLAVEPAVGRPDSPHSEGDAQVGQKSISETAKDTFQALAKCLEFAACGLLPFAGDAIANWGMHRTFTRIATDKLQKQESGQDVAEAQNQYALYFAANVVNTLVTAAFLAYYAAMPVPAAVATGGLLLARLILNARHSGTAHGIAETVEAVRMARGLEETRPGVRKVR
jgi:hypothetical protein